MGGRCKPQVCLDTIEEEECGWFSCYTGGAKPHKRDRRANSFSLSSLVSPTTFLVTEVSCQMFQVVQKRKVRERQARVCSLLGAGQMPLRIITSTKMATMGEAGDKSLSDRNGDVVLPSSSSSFIKMKLGRRHSFHKIQLSNSWR